MVEIADTLVEIIKSMDTLPTDEVLRKLQNEILASHEQSFTDGCEAVRVSLLLAINTLKDSPNFTVDTIKDLLEYDGLIEDTRTSWSMDNEI